MVADYRKNRYPGRLEFITKKIFNESVSDPIFYRDERNFKDELLMFAATKDSKVRPFSQLSLWEVFSKPPIYRLTGMLGNNHKYHILQFAYKEDDKWIPFFIKKLSNQSYGVK
jgi:hypothetical protein